MSPGCAPTTGDHLGGLPRPARLAWRRGGRDLDGRRRRRRPAGRGRQPGAGVRPVGGALPARDPGEAVGVPRPGRPADGDLRRDEGAWPSSSTSTPRRPPRRRTRCRRCDPDATSIPGCAGLDDLLSEVVRPGQTRYGELERRLGISGTADRLLSDARDAGRGAQGGRRPRVAPRSIRCRRASRSRSSEPRCSTPRPRTEPREMPVDGEHYRAAVDFHQMVGSLGRPPRPAASPRAGRGPRGPGRRTCPRRRGSYGDPGARGAGRRGACARASPTTRAYSTVASRFVAARQAPDPAVPEGLVPLSASSFVVNQVDIDGAALKAIATATTATTPPPAARRPRPGPTRRRRPRVPAHAPASRWCRPAAPTCCRPSSAAAARSTTPSRAAPHSCSRRTWSAATGWTCATTSPGLALVARTRPHDHRRSDIPPGLSADRGRRASAGQPRRAADAAGPGARPER